MKKNHQTDEQIAAGYGRVVSWGTWLGVIGLVIPFGLYVSGLLPALVPFVELPGVWSQSASWYLGHTGLTPGWAWVRRISQTDILCYLGIAVLCVTTVVAMANILPKYIRAKQTVPAVIVAIEILVLMAAISGVIGIGG